MKGFVPAAQQKADPAEKYEQAKAALAGEDLVLFEQLLDPPQADRAHCKIEARDVPEGRGHGEFWKELRVRAVRVPLRELLTRMAEAGGIEIEIPPEVSGLADLSQGKWRRVDGVIWMFCAARGLNFGRPMQRVFVTDPLYTASLRGRAAAPGCEAGGEGPGDALRRTGRSGASAAKGAREHPAHRHSARVPGGMGDIAQLSREGVAPEAGSARMSVDTQQLGVPEKGGVCDRIRLPYGTHLDGGTPEENGIAPNEDSFVYSFDVTTDQR